ncbi:MAG: alpha/beta hydrolase [Phaeodactylibacter sp.]|nr:alpha/beta hydrolase [Phaeodactylibacter sp.]MCB9272856.1 alpha/beta hydrolase [Lewinellaceae bacterium]
MKYVTYHFKKVAFLSEGKGTPVVLLHGFCEDSTIWDDFAAALLEEPFRIIRIDLPGFGKSEVLPDATIEQMAEAVQVVLKSLRLKQVILIGHSMGGYVSLAFARRFPGMLLGLGLFHSHPYPDTAEKKEGRRKSIAFIGRQGHILFVKQLIPALFTPKFARSNSFLLEKLIFSASKYKSTGIMAALEAMASRPDESGTLAGIEAPALFIIGEEDSAIPPAQSLEQIHLPAAASIHILGQVGHMGMFEAKRKTEQAVREFVFFCSNKSQS